MTVRSDVSEDVGREAPAVPTTQNSNKAVRKGTRNFFVLGIRGSVEIASEGAIPQKGDWAAGVPAKSGYRAVWAKAIPVSVSAAPTSCTGSSDSPSHAQATAIATTGSSIPVMPASVAEI